MLNLVKINVFDNSECLVKERFRDPGLLKPTSVMNHFAHLALSQPTRSSAVGNLLVDFMRGVAVEDLSPAVRRGLENHRAVDRYTDQDSRVGELKSLFSASRRRFAGVALDIYFDHLLIRHWEQLETGTARQHIEASYRQLREGQPLMPSERMQHVTQRMVEDDWFGRYREVESVARAMNRVASRIRFEHQFDNSMEEILQHEEEIRGAFLDFYPRLKAHIEELGIEHQEGADTV